MLQTRLLFVSTILIALFSVSITFYGFFLTTVKISDTSGKNLLTNTTDPWFEPKTKVIMLLIDSLRFDYFNYNESIAGQEQYPYQNRFTKVHEITKNNPENFVTIRAYSDAPTWTVQRIRCLATGNIPPFIQLAQSLGASAAIDDSIFKQVKNADGKSYAMGDPLWKETFADDVIDKFKSNSFDLKDMDSDKTVSDNMLSVIQQNDFDLLVGHRLGVDHIGHSYGTNLDPRIGEQLTLNDDLAAEIINTMDNNTVLFILGDHGMRADGGHGGSSDDETGTVIAAYYKNGFQKYKSSGLEKLMKSIDDRSTSTMQVDLTPTLAMLLGVPIPFSNLGQIINDFYPNVIKMAKTSNEDSSNQNRLEDNSTSSFVAEILHDNYLNTLQIYNFIVTFQNETQTFEKDRLTSSYDLFKEIQDEYKRVNSLDHQTPEFQEQTVNLILKMQSFSNDTYQLIRTTSSYDNFLVTVGMLLIVLVLIAYILLVQQMHSCQNDVKAFHSLQNWTFKKSLTKVLSDKILYCVLLGAVIIAIAFKPKIMHLLSGIIFLFVIKGIYLLGIAVFYPHKKATSYSEKDSSSTDLISTLEKSGVELGNVFLPIDQEKGREDKTPTHRDALGHKKTSIFFTASPIQTMLVVFAMASSIVTANLPATVVKLENANTNYLKPNTPLLLMLTLLYITYKYVNKRVYQIIALTLIVGSYGIVKSVNPSTSWSIVQPQLALFLFGLFLQSRVKSLHQSYNRFSIKWLHLIIFFALWVYYTPTNRENIWITIIIPRIIFGLLLASSIAGCILTRLTMWQNLQLCLIEFLFLLQGPGIILSFATLLSLLRLTNFAFKKLKFQSFAYPIIIAVESYIGLFMLDHTDRYLSKINFGQAFIGLNQFNLYLSSTMVLMSTFSSFILGMTFIVNYLQNITLKQNGLILHVDEDDTFEQVNEKSANNQQEANQPDQSQSVNEHSESTIDRVHTQYQLKLLKIKNNLLFVFSFSAIYMTALLRCYLERDNFINLTEGNERYILDAAIYIFTMISMLPLMF